jgi:hypothetical protein
MPAEFQNMGSLEARHNFDLTKKTRFHDDMLKRRTDADTEERPSEFLSTIPWFVPSICVNIAMILWSVTTEGFGLVIGFIEYLQVVTTCNYSAIANSRTQQFITARTQSAVSSPVVVW